MLLVIFVMIISTEFGNIFERLLKMQDARCCSYSTPAGGEQRHSNRRTFLCCTRHTNALDLTLTTDEYRISVKNRISVQIFRNLPLFYLTASQCLKTHTFKKQKQTNNQIYFPNDI